ncbi:MAG TPA: hypothetical protein VD948_12580 [Rhodothermales bacterium]|nr:hypothetical protein [Rhodothermales bacterium]
MSGALSWNGTVVRPLMPASGETQNGEPFAVPKGARVMTVHVPALAGSNTTVKVQALAPVAGVDQSANQTWADVTAFDVTDGGYEALDGIPESTTATFPVSVTGGGMLRLVASADQSASPVAIPVFFA